MPWKIKPTSLRRNEIHSASFNIIELGSMEREKETRCWILNWAQVIARGLARTMGIAKRVFNYAHFANLEQALDYDARIQDIARRGEKFNEGLQAFMEKRQSKFL